MLFRSCASRAHCNAAQLLQIQDAMLQISDGRLGRCPWLWTSAAASSKPADMQSHTLQSNHPKSAKFQWDFRIRNSRDTSQQKRISTSASYSCKQLQPWIASESVSLIMQSWNTCQAAVTGQPQPCNWSCKCKPDKEQCNSRAGRSKQGAKGHWARFGCSWIRSSLHPAVLCNQLGSRTKTKQAYKANHHTEHAANAAAATTIPQ